MYVRTIINKASFQRSPQPFYWLDSELSSFSEEWTVGISPFSNKFGSINVEGGEDLVDGVGFAPYHPVQIHYRVVVRRFRRRACDTGIVRRS